MPVAFRPFNPIQEINPEASPRLQNRSPVLRPETQTVTPLPGVESTTGGGGVEGPRPTQGVDFGQALANALSRASAADKASEEMAVRFAEGDPGVGIHEVIIAGEKSSIAVRFAVTAKNRAIESYRELMNTPL